MPKQEPPPVTGRAGVNSEMVVMVGKGIMPIFPSTCKLEFVLIANIFRRGVTWKGCAYSANWTEPMLAHHNQHVAIGCLQWKCAIGWKKTA